MSDPEKNLKEPKVSYASPARASREVGEGNAQD